MGQGFARNRFDSELIYLYYLYFRSCVYQSQQVRLGKPPPTCRGCSEHGHLEDFVLFFSRIRRDRRRFLKSDPFAGLTVAVVAVPQSMAYALIAGLPVQYGLYASIVPVVVGCLGGSSAQLITGPATAVSLVVSSALSLLAIKYRCFT